MSNSPLGAILKGVVGGVVGVAAMDVLLYMRYRRDGGRTPPMEWEFGGKSSWDAVGAPAQVGRRLYEGFTQDELPPAKARLTNNIMHWAYGIGWGTVFGTFAGTAKNPRLGFGPPFGAAVWLSSYVVMPVAGLYKPIWEYDRSTLWRDLTAHLVYGTAVAATFRVFTRSNGHD